MSLNNSLPDQQETGFPSPSEIYTPSTPSMGYIMTSPPNPLKSPVTRPTAFERFLEPSISTVLFPSIRPHLVKGDLKRLAQVPGAFNMVATIALYQKRSLSIGAECENFEGEIGEALLAGMDYTPVGRISKKEAFSYITEIYLDESNYRMAKALLRIQFPRLKTLVIQARYLIDLLLQSHAKKATAGIPYTDFYNPDTPFDFAEAQLIRHLASYASKVQIWVPDIVLKNVDQDRWSGHYAPVAHHLGISDWIIEGKSCIDWSGYLATEPYRSRFPPGTAVQPWWAVPDLGNRLSLGNIQPIDILVIRIDAASTTFHGLPARRIEIKLEEKALTDKDGGQYFAHQVPELAVIKSILDTRAVTKSTVVVQLLSPPRMGMIDYIRALYPEIDAAVASQAQQLDGPDDAYESIDFEEVLMMEKTRAEVNSIYRFVLAKHLETFKDTLFNHHAKTDVEKEDFAKIEFGYRKLEEFEGCEYHQVPLV